MVTRDQLARALPTVIGLSGIAAVVGGLWGLFGWQVGLIAAGLPFAAFYIAGEVVVVMHALPRKE